MSYLYHTLSNETVPSRELLWTNVYVIFTSLICGQGKNSNLCIQIPYPASTKFNLLLLHLPVLSNKFAGAMHGPRPTRCSGESLHHHNTTRLSALQQWGVCICVWDFYVVQRKEQEHRVITRKIKLT